MTAQTEPRPEAATEPQRVLHLHAAGFATREIGKLLNLSQSTVVRRLQDARTAEQIAARRQKWLAAMYVLLTLSAVVVAAAAATVAWVH
jgi:DNA-binding NarL/FixJ family response regulator